jgi:hypothetical protein
MEYRVTDLPVLGLTVEHHRILILGNIIIFLDLSLLDRVLGLETFILGEGTVVARLLSLLVWAQKFAGD